jgi:hypothetical protein
MRRKMRDKIASFVAKLKGLPRILRQILYGMMIHEMDLGLRKEKGGS